MDNKVIAAIALPFVFIVGLFVALWTYRPDESRMVKPNQTSESTATLGINKPTDDNYNIAPQQSPFDFSWVDGNDQGTLQGVEIWVKYLKNGLKLPAAGEGSLLLWEAGMEQEFMVEGCIYDKATAKTLGGWGYHVHIFDDATHQVVNDWYGKSNAWTGTFAFNFKLKPAQAGVYRVRVAAGDAADEDAIVFNLPRNTPTAMQLADGRLGR